MSVLRSLARPCLTAALLAALAPAPARALIAADAQAVVERFLAVTGGRDAFERERTTRLRARVTAFGLTGSIEAWSERPLRSASVTSIGPFTLREGTDGETAWRVDQNGKFALRDGKDLEDARSSAWFQNDMWAAADQGGGSVRLVGTERDSAGAYTVIEAAPPGGRARRLWFNVRTGLLERSELRDDLQTVTSRLSGYRMIAGRLRPTVTLVTVASMPMNDARIELDTLWVNEPIAAAVFAPPAAGGPRDARFLAGGARAVVPFEYYARHVWVKAAVNGGPLADFLVDTGASVTVLDSGYAARRGIAVEGRIQVPGAGQTGGASLSQVDSIVVPASEGGGVHVAAQRVAVMALDPYLEPFFWRSCAGVLGYDFISRFVMTVDFGGERLVLEDPAAFQYQGRGQAVPLEMAGNIPVVEAVLDDSLRGKFRLDVGSGSTVDLHSPFVRRHDLSARAGRKVAVMGGGFGGTFTSELTRMNTMAIGPFSWDQPLVSLSQATIGGLASEDYAGNIGNQLLERFTVTFDYERRQVWLEPGRRFTQPDRFSLAGAQFARVGGVVRALQVLPGSAAAEAGLQEGDEVRKLDGRPIAAWSLDQVSELFEEGKPGDKHTLDILRDGRKQRLRMVLRTIL